MPVNGIAELTAQVKAVSGIYAARFGIDRDADWYLLKLAEEVGELVGAALAASGRSRPSMPADQLDAAVQDELADVMAHTLLLADHLAVDLDQAVARKWLAYLPSEPVD